MATKSKAPKKKPTSRIAKKSLVTKSKLNYGLLAIFAGILALAGIFYVLYSQAAAPVVPSGYREVFKDDFDGTALNTAVWKPYHNTYGDGNKEEQCLTPNNVAVASGVLRITAKREQVTCPNGSVRQFTSGFLGTRENGVYFPKYARYEMRAKLPHGQGLWPGFWLRHKNGSSTAEVDVMEYFHAQVPGKTTTTIHLDGTANVAKQTTFFETPTATPGWHTWAVEMQPDPTNASLVQFKFMVDGNVVKTVTPTQQKWASAVDSNAMFDMAVNMSVGGNNTGHPDDDLGWSRYQNFCLKPYRAAPPCDPTGIWRTSFPVTYEVDYVRVLVKDSSTVTSTVTPTPTTTSTVSPTPTTGVIPVPTSFLADPVVGGVNLSWAASTDARVDEYSVRYIRSDSTTKSDGSTWVYPGRTITPSQGITGLAAGVSYDFQVRAIDNLGTADSADDLKSEYAATIVAAPKAEVIPTPTTTVTPSPTPTPTTTITPPPPPTDTTAPSAPTNVKGSIVWDAFRFSYYTNLTWGASSDNVGVTSYIVKRNGTTLGTPTKTNFQDYNIAANTYYTYDIQARDAAGNTSTATSARLVGRCFLIWCWAE